MAWARTDRQSHGLPPSFGTRRAGQPRFDLPAVLTSLNSWVTAVMQWNGGQAAPGWRAERGSARGWIVALGR
jgi:hypothetical protein